MRLARKITIAITAAILLIMAMHAYFLLHREVLLFDADLARSVNLKRALRASVARVWEAYGDVEAQHLVERTMVDATEGVRIRWTWLDAPPGDLRYLDLSQAERAQLQDGQGVVVFHRERDGALERYTYMPESIPGRRPAVLEFIEPIGEQRAFIEASRWQILLATLAILVACAAAVHWLGVWYVGRPIEHLRERLRAVAGGDLETEVALRQHDEIGDLAREIDAMRRALGEARRQLAAEAEAHMSVLERLRHTDRLTTIGQLAAGVAHDLGTPLAVISGRAEMIVSGEAVGERASASARVIVEQAGDMARPIRQLLDFSRRRAPRFETLSVRALCARTVDTLAVMARRRDITIVARLGDDPLWVSADELLIQQALVNVLVNAMQAMTNGGRIDITTGERRARPAGADRPEADFVCVTVVDQGPGIPTEHLAHLFEPFFTTKDAGEGTGLGLAVAQGIARDHAGWVEVDSTVGQGSRFRIFLPLAPAGKTKTLPHHAA